MVIRGRGTRRGRGRGRGDPPQPSESCNSPLLPHGEDNEIQLMMKRPQESHLDQVYRYIDMVTRGRGGISAVTNNEKMSNATFDSVPPHASTSRGKLQQNERLVKGADALKEQKIVGDYNEGDDEEMQLIWDKISHFSSNP